jgi:4-hydroxybenzoyl-CoA reductase subunit beta
VTTALAELRLAQPTTVKEAITTLLSHPRSRLIAGGTDLLVNIRRGISRPDLLVDISGIDELAEINFNDGGMTIGAGVTIASIAGNAAVGTHYRALAQAAGAIAAPGHRNLATLGGNLCLDTRCIYYNQSEWWRKANSYCLKNRGDVCHVAPQGKRCHAAFSGDLAPALLVLGAEVDIVGAQGVRRIPLQELYVEDGKAHLTLADGELVAGVHLPATPPMSAYAKVRVRGAIDYPLAGVAVSLALSGAGIGSLRIALTGTNSCPLLLSGTDAFALRSVDDKLLQEIDRLVQKQVQPMRTTLASANYRRVSAAALARRLTASLFAECRA